MFHESVTAATIPGLRDAQRIRWPLVGGLLCVLTVLLVVEWMPISALVLWEELVAFVRHTQRTLPSVPISFCNDANVWWLAFHLGRERHRDRSVFPYIHELLRLHAGHTKLEGFDLVFISVALGARIFIVHQGDECCSLSPLCSPALGSDHFLCDFPQVSFARRNFPVVQDWEPILLVPEPNLMIGKLLCKSCQFLTLNSHSVPLSVRCFITWWQFCGTLPSHFTRQFPMSLATDANHGGGRTPATMHWLFAAQRGETFEGLIFRKTTLSSFPVGLLPPFDSHNPPQLEILARRRRPLAHAGPQGLRESYPPTSDCQTVAAHPMPQCGGVHRPLCASM